MPEKTTSQEVKSTETHTIKFKKIGNTMFKINSYYSGEDTYEDIVKDALTAKVENFYS